MDRDTQQQIVQHIIASWAELSERRRPRCLWLHLHEPIALLAAGFPTPLLEVWFLDASGLHPQNPMEFVRFWVIHVDKPWCTRMHGEPNNRIFGNPHEIGLAGFAQYQTTADVYLEVDWGGRDGRGALLTSAGEGRLQEKAVIWVS